MISLLGVRGDLFSGCQCSALANLYRCYGRTFEAALASVARQGSTQVASMCRLVDAFAAALGEDPASFRAAHFAAPMLFLRPLRYSPAISSPADGVLGAGAHSDYGLFTLLATDGTPGLQIQQQGRWLDVPHVPHALVVNVGDMAERCVRCICSFSVCCRGLLLCVCCLPPTSATGPSGACLATQLLRVCCLLPRSAAAGARAPDLCSCEQRNRHAWARPAATGARCRALTLCARAVLTPPQRRAGEPVATSARCRASARRHITKKGSDRKPPEHTSPGGTCTQINQAILAPIFRKHAGGQTAGTGPLSTGCSRRQAARATRYPSSLRFQQYCQRSPSLVRRWTNGRYKSTLHRVLSTAGRARYSMPFFFEPSFDARVECLPSCRGAAGPRFEATTAGEHLLHKYRQTHAAFEAT